MSRPGIQRDRSIAATPMFEAPVQADKGAVPLRLASLPKVPKLKKREADLVKLKDETFARSHALGYAQGFEQGRAEGLEKGAQDGFDTASAQAARDRQIELESYLASLQKTLETVDEAMLRWYQLAEAEMSEIIVDLAKAVIIEELKLGRESIATMVKDAMSRITHASEARIRINPLDSDLMKSLKDELISNSASVRTVEIVDDPSFVGGCVIETDGGLVDARVENKLEVVVEELRRAA